MEHFFSRLILALCFASIPSSINGVKKKRGELKDCFHPTLSLVIEAFPFERAISL